MRETRDVFRTVAVILLGLFALVIGVPLVLALIGITFHFIFALAVLLIKVAVFLAVGYLVLVAVRAALR